jgi:malate synthase
MISSERQKEASLLAAKVLTPGLRSFLSNLHRRFNPEREHLLKRRKFKQLETDSGLLPGFLPETASVRNSVWEIAPVPSDLQDRRTEIVTSVHANALINALNSGARVCVADFEDYHSPEWIATLQGQLNLRDAVAGSLKYFSPDGTDFSIRAPHATLMVRPRGWHLVEKHVQVDGQPISAALFDFGVYFYHNANALIRRGSGPYFYLPKMESHLEARLWNEVFLYAQAELGISAGTIKATALIESVLAVFEMHEILYELRDHSAGLSHGSWDYIFSFIKKFKSNKNIILPDRNQINPLTHFLKSSANLLVQTSHWRGAHAIGAGTSHCAVFADHESEVQSGKDGTWISNPSFHSSALRAFTKVGSDINQFHRLRADVSVTREDLLCVPPGEITEEGFRKNVGVSLFYIDAWLGGIGSFSYKNLTELTATAEVSRSLIWQWMRRSKGRTSQSRKINSKYFEEVLNQEMNRTRSSDFSRLGESAEILRKLVYEDDFIDSLPQAAYDWLD